MSSWTNIEVHNFDHLLCFHFRNCKSSENVGKANDNVHIENIRMPLVYEDIDLDFDNLGGEYLSSIANYLVDAITDYITKDKDKLLVDNVKKMIDNNFDTLIC